ncbi:13527_t:CDS:2 [Entrophospora sp. SA101]|nr:3041_t:CDS:2 [Entrophospora sp. SA101]CAJ0764553.1 13527_t:CDS:2 [Entrophospora sp. SA101]CAJ0836583.1 3808_t:CDS:2 [Entrophospora sp. SA101]
MELISASEADGLFPGLSLRKFQKFLEACLDTQRSICQRLPNNISGACLLSVTSDKATSERETVALSKVN